MISFDATAGANAVANSLTFSHTCSGSKRLLIVGVTTNGATGDKITGVTYNGVSMTKVKTENIGTGQFSYLFLLINPAIGANNVVVSDSETPGALRAQSVSYTGADQTTQPDASGNGLANPGTTVTASVTVVNNNCWMVSIVGNDSALAETPSGVLTTARGNQNQVLYMGDSNGTISQGSQNATWTSSSQNITCCAISINDSIYRVSLSDTLSITEKFLKILSILFKDTLSITESFAKLELRVLNYSDSLTLSEKIGKKAQKLFINSLSITEKFIKLSKIVFNNTLSLTESFSKIKFKIRLFADTLSLTESFKRRLNGGLIIWVKKAKAKLESSFIVEE